MIKGFYNLTSGMLTQQRNLNVVGNNLVNISTSGFKQDRYTATTFDEVLYSWTGNKDKDYVGIGQQSYIRASSDIYTDYRQGIPEPTGIPLDFAIYGDGFFAVQLLNGGTAYTRSGSFSLDDEGYLCYPGQGRILSAEGQPIYLGTDKIEADGLGNIFNENGGLLGRLGVYSFEDMGGLEHNDQGMFTGAGAAVMENPALFWKCLERSNTDMVQQMTEMITCQRSLQSAAQVIKMYDDVMNKASNSLGQM